MDIHQKIQRDKNQLFATIDNEVVMLSIENGKYYGLNSIASDVWAILEEPATIAQVVDRLMDDYVVDRETCTADVCELIDELYGQKLIILA
ncbi:MAG: lasso peptide biosynthesis PqqD family chaperone [Bacteroidales bacterium]|nr:lasso peptide biosynthesis PqqD family chaperone [Bacteroidales bacterium]